MRALISGYYGEDNTGDDCLMAVTTWGIRTYLNPARLFATAGKIPIFMNSGSVTAIHAARQVVKGHNRMAEWITSVQSDTVVFGGGSVFYSICDMRRKMDLLRLSGKGPHFAIGVSLGPFNSRETERYCEELLKRLSFVGLRDQESADIAQSFSSDINFKKTFDLAPLLPRANNLTADHLTSASGERSGIGIALCDYERFVGGDTSREKMRRRKLIDTINSLPRSLNDEIVLIDFNGHPKFGDSPIHADIRRKLLREFKVRYLPYTGNPLKVMKEIGRLRLIIAMRLHAAVFGYITGTPTIMLSYHPKCTGWASQIELASKYVLDSSEFEVSHLKQVVMEILENEFIEPQLGRLEAERLALLNFSMLKMQN